MYYITKLKGIANVQTSQSVLIMFGRISFAGFYGVLLMTGLVTTVQTFASQGSYALTDIAIGFAYLSGGLAGMFVLLRFNDRLPKWLRR